jgi:hypothetical protein
MKQDHPSAFKLFSEIHFQYHHLQHLISIDNFVCQTIKWTILAFQGILVTLIIPVPLYLVAKRHQSLHCLRVSSWQLTHMHLWAFSLDWNRLKIFRNFKCTLTHYYHLLFLQAAPQVPTMAQVIHLDSSMKTIYFKQGYFSILFKEWSSCSHYYVAYQTNLRNPN